MTILSFTFFSLFILTVGLDYQVLSLTTTTKASGERYVQMRAGAPFKIALFADLHFGEATSADWGPLQDVNSTRVINTVLDGETPGNLGDVITANNIPIANASLYWGQAISPTKSRGIPFASVFGNHDDAPFEWPKEWFPAPGIPRLIFPAVNSTHSGEEACSFRGTQRIELMKHEIEHNVLSYSSNGPKALWPNSGGGSYPQVISNAQAEWFQNKSEEIKPNSSVPEPIFWHIPSQAYNKVAPQFGIHKPCVGSIKKENVSSQAAELGIMELLVKRPSVKYKNGKPLKYEMGLATRKRHGVMAWAWAVASQHGPDTTRFHESIRDLPKSHKKRHNFHSHIGGIHQEYVQYTPSQQVGTMDPLSARAQLPTICNLALSHIIGMDSSLISSMR
uniref:Calcineurin-like phosphoesterase domain-containing protein n=1 Tax=Quercus lobata TaxID=97700 RepID=A0A7N2M253_QUELO